MEGPYAFRRSDNGRIVWVDFETMMRQDVAGFIRLPDGVEARRCVNLEGHLRRKSVPPPSAVSAPAISDAMGFPEECLADREKQRQLFGCQDVEFKRDPLDAKFFQVHGASRRALDNYAKRRNLVNRTGSLGGKTLLSQADLDRAAGLVSRKG